MTSLPHQSGFSMVELIVSLGVVSIVFVIASNMVINGLNSQRFINEQKDAIVDARAALEVMHNELREMTSADTGAYPLLLADAQEIIFYSDVDSDLSTERVRYYLSGTLLQRGVIEPTGNPVTYNPNNEIVSTLASYVVNDTQPIFTYYNEDYPEDQVTNPLMAPINETEVRLLQMFVSSNVDPQRVPETHDLVVSVQLRNVKENF